jgi:hypothetical protein
MLVTRELAAITLEMSETEIRLREKLDHLDSLQDALSNDEEVSFIRSDAALLKTHQRPSICLLVNVCKRLKSSWLV